MAITLATLQQRVLDLMDEASTQVATPAYVTTGQITDQINNAYGQLWSIYMDKDPKYFETDYAFTPTVNTRDYALPTLVRRVIKVFALPSPGTSAAISTHIPLDRTMRDSYMAAPSQYSYYYPNGAWIPTYEIYGANIRLDPTPTATPQFQIAIWYQPHFTPLVNTSDSLDPGIFPGHEQFIVLHAVVMLRMGKEEQPADDLAQERERVQQMIERDLNVRDVGSGKVIVDTEIYDGWVR